jgi:hypothetical protein
MKIFGSILTALLGAALGLCAQPHGKTVSYSTPLRETPRATGSTHKADDKADDSKFLKPEFINNISVNAVRDFIKRFTERSDTRWYKLPDGSFLARFEDTNIAYRAAYTSRGAWIYTIQTYHEKQLPRDVRAQVKSTYYDYAITQVEEINHINNDFTVYIVHMKDDTCWKTVRVSDGQMDLIETLYKR